jgi:hypothetical protein
LAINPPLQFGLFNQARIRAAVPLEHARAVSINTDASFARKSASDQRLDGAEILTAATGAPSSPKTGAAIVISPR